MEHHEQTFTLSPCRITLSPGEQILKFSIKNTSSRSTRYQIFPGEGQHFRVLNSRTFHLAPGMAKMVKLQHSPSEGRCSPHEEVLQVMDGNGRRQFLQVRCMEERETDRKKVELQGEINLEKIRPNEERQLEIPFRNVGQQNLKVKATYYVPSELRDMVQFKLLDEQMIVLKQTSKKVRGSIKLLKEVDFEMEVVLDFTEEVSRERWQETVKIRGNSLIRSQFVADSHSNRIESVTHELLNGTAVSGSIFLVNNYHRACPFRVMELIQIVDYRSYCEKLDEISVKLDVTEGEVIQKGIQKLNYTLVTTPTQNDRSFTERYSQLAIKDEANSCKLRNTNFFKKNLEIVLRVQFGEDNPIQIKLKAHVINPALKINKISSGNIDVFDVMNNSGIEVPFKFSSNLYYSTKNTKGKLREGMNQFQIQWRKQAPQSPNTKQNMDGFLRCAIKMQIPKNGITLFQPSLLQRPKSALIRSGSANLSRQNLKEKISMRAPSKAGSFGVKNLKEISVGDFMTQANRYARGEAFQEGEFKLLQVSQNQRGNVITNSHKSKHILVHFPQKGYLLFQSQHSYLFPYQRKSLRFQFSGKAFQVKSREIQDRQPYKILSKELIFSFSGGQKEFQVVRQVQIQNRSSEYMMVYCLSIDDDYFHSLQPDHKIVIPPKANGVFKLGFFPKAEIRLKQSKISRNIQFLINDQKEAVLCLGDLLAGEVDVDEKKLYFANCKYSHQEVKKKVNIVNKGLNKVSFMVQHSDNIKITPKSYFINEKKKITITISFVPVKIPKQYHENVVIFFKGSHAIVIPLKVTTLEPQIQCLQNTISFKEGYLNETVTACINIVNHNGYQCRVNANCEGTELKTQKNVTIAPGQTKRLQFELLVSEIGQKIVKLPSNFIELCGYGALKGPSQYRILGRKTVLQLIPDNPFANLQFSQIQQTKSFKIRNLSPEVQSLELVLTPYNRGDCQDAIIVSCQPTFADLMPGEQKQFKLLSIRGDCNFLKNQSKIFKYSLSLNLQSNKKYRRFDFNIQVPPPQLQISPSEVYFPLATVGTWSKSSFKIFNKGYKEVLVAIKKPVNIAFELQVKPQNQQNRLTRLNNLMEVSVYYKSMKPVSFSVNLDVQDNFGRKYLVKLLGTSSNSPLLNCQRTISSSSKGFSSSDMRSTTTPILTSSSTIGVNSEQTENIRFINRWFSSILSDFAKDNENFNFWLKIPRNFIQLLKYFKLQISNKEDSLESVLEQLKRHGLPVYTIRVAQLMQGNLEQWSMCLWFILSKELIHEDTLKWVNRICRINIETYDNALSHQKKIFNDLLSKLFQPIFKGKVTDLQKILDYLEPSFPVLTKIQNKKQFTIAINLLYSKLAKMERKKVTISDLDYNLKIDNRLKIKKNYWVLGNSPLQATFGPNCLNSKQTSQRKLLHFGLEGEETINIKLKNDLNIAVWNNTLHEPLKIYELQINKKLPQIHNISIECEIKCSQQWKLNFPCEVQSQYFFEFSGGMEFKCKMPDLGIIKSGDIMEFRIIYSPTNLKEHFGVLKISNRYEQHVYNLKGKSLRSNYIQIERNIHIPQGEKHVQTFSVVEDPEVCSEFSSYKVSILGEGCQEVKSVEAKSNKKEIMVQVAMQFSKVIQQKEVFLQLFNDQMTFCKNIRLVVNVVPRPLIVQARLKGVIDKVTIEKIPITNALPVKQNCFISLRKIGKEDYDNVSRYLLERQEGEGCIQGEEFKLSHLGKIVLKPKEKININLSFTPNTLTQSLCQIRIKMEGVQNIIIYNFLGVPQLPFTDNPPIVLKCQAEQQSFQTIKIPNRLKERVIFQVQTNLPFIAGSQQISVNSRESFNYQFKVLPLHAGTFEGEIIFKNQKFILVYPLKVVVVSKKKVRKIRVQSKIRVTSTIQIELSNKLDKDIEYEVLCKSQFLKVEPTFLLPANSEKALILTYTPLFVGTRTAQLKLYHESMQEISYNLQMISEEHKESLKFACELGQKKKIKISVKNPTSIPTQLCQPRLPKELSYHLSGNQNFPINLPAFGLATLQFFFTQYSMSNNYRQSIELPTGEIGNFYYDLLFVNEQVKKMQETVIHYLESERKEVIRKDLWIEVLNYFDEPLQFQMVGQKLDITSIATVTIEAPLKFQLKGYEKRRIKCEVSIDDDKKSNKVSPDKKISTRQKNNEIVIESKGFKWVFPIQIVQIYEIKSVLEIVGNSQEMARARISLKYIKGIKNWIITDIPNYRQNFNLSFISSREVYLQTIFNKPYEYCGYVMFYDEDMSCAQKYPLNIKIGEKKFEKVWITANVGERSKVQIRLKNGKGNYKVSMKNNKMKEFYVTPMSGEFKEKEDNVIYFEYAPVEYNGNKKAEVYITSEYGSFNFYLMGKFPPLK